MEGPTNITYIPDKLPMSFLEAFCVINRNSRATHSLKCNVKYDSQYSIFRAHWPHISPPGNCILITSSSSIRLSCAVQNSSTYVETPWPFSSPPMSCELKGRSLLNQTLQCMVKNSKSTLLKTPWLFDFLPTPCMLQHNMRNIFCCPPFNKGYTTFTRQVEFIIGFWTSLFVCLFGLIGSVLSFLVLSTSQIHSSIVILKGVSVCDGSFCLWYLTFELYKNIYYGKRNWILNHGSESVHVLPWVNPYIEEIESILIHISIWFIVLLTANRFVIVCKPMKAKILCTIRRTTISMILLVIVCLGSSVPSFLMVEPYWSKSWCSEERWVEEKYTKLGGSPMFLKIYVICFKPLVFHILPTVSVIMMTIAILVSLKKASKKRAEMRGTGVTTASKNEDKLTRLFIAVAVMFLCFVMPRVVADIMRAQDLLFFPTSFQDPTGFIDSMKNNNKTIYLHIVSNLCLRLNASLNFVLYILVNKEFRENLCHLPNRLICRCYKHKRQRLRSRINGSPYASRHHMVTTQI
ncbi:unnamed protein product [Owenia fusiformis]|uniref:Uncharacterized protein n=1 Tax=Owenia fusiformis TaxID=6347 RepID=A0A8J1U9U2_OWEFU|nr:unnamed protein product [Owenia fusiformis]